LSKAVYKVVDIPFKGEGLHRGGDTLKQRFRTCSAWDTRTGRGWTNGLSNEVYRFSTLLSSASHTETGSPRQI